jgi:hypothetical protein
MASPTHTLNGQDTPSDMPARAEAVEWIGRRGDREPDVYAAMTAAERIELVWPITVTAWAFSGKPCDESRRRRDVESLGRRKR